jgi:hypothetical protein
MVFLVKNRRRGQNKKMQVNKNAPDEKKYQVSRFDFIAPGRGFLIEAGFHKISSN